jgi:hypothetical protein
LPTFVGKIRTKGWASAMATYYPDTNVLIDLKRPEIRAKIERAIKAGDCFVIAPPVLIELVSGIIKGGRDCFPSEKEIFVWLHDHKFPILPLPNPFMASILKSTATGKGGVEPSHYQELIELVSTSSDLDDLLRKAANGVWRDVSSSHQVHADQLDKELLALGSLARVRLNYAEKLSGKFGVPGCRPIPLIVAGRFSAALEFLESSITKVKGGAKLRKNDPGVYFDFQLFFYLADPSLSFLTQENFSAEIKKSPQRTRIVPLATLP